MKNTLETRLGFFAAIIVIAAVLILETLGGLPFKKGKHLRALFNTVHELKEGDRVKMGGVEIGQVEKIQLTEASKVEVSMKIDADARVKTDSTATIRFAGLMGQNFVSIDFGSPSAELADNNTVLPTVEQPDLNAIMKRLDNVAAGVENLTKSFSGDKIDNILGPLTDFFKQNNNQISATLTNIRTISTQIADGKGTVGKLIMEDTLYNTALNTVSNMQETATDLRATIADARSVISDAKAGKGTIGKLMTEDALYNETTNSMTNLKEILQKVNRGQGTVAKIINDDEFYKNAKLTLQKVDKATESLEDQGPISVMGTLFTTFY